MVHICPGRYCRGLLLFILEVVVFRAALPLEAYWISNNPYHHICHAHHQSITKFFNLPIISSPPYRDLYLFNMTHESLRTSETLRQSGPDMATGQAIVIMGVSGAGKSTVGELLSAKLECDFYDSDNFHSAKNKEKMKNGIPLADEDRAPWLETLRDLMIDHILRGRRVVLACSALRPKYRDLLRTADYEFLSRDTPEALSNSNGSMVTEGNGVVDAEAKRRRNLGDHVVFVYLKGTAELLEARLVARDVAGMHFMPAVLLQSQIDTLKIEKGEGDLLEMDASLPPSQILENVRRRLSI